MCGTFSATESQIKRQLCMIHWGFYDKFRRDTIFIPRMIFIAALFGYGLYADIRLQIFVDVRACAMFVMKSYIANSCMQPDLTGGSDYPLSHLEHAILT
jgi:hypothetical protein